MENLSISNESDHPELTRIIQSNHHIRKTVQDQTENFLKIQNDLLKNLQDQKLNATIIEQTGQQFFNLTEIQSLNKHVTSPKVQLALVGANSCGKTSFLHLLLRSGSFLPADVGSVSARIIRLTYADSKDARLYVYASLNDKKINDQVSLSEFCLDRQEPDWNGIKTAIKDHVARPNPQNIKPNSDEFAQWAKLFVEIRIPSSFLKLGIDVYDTPGLIFSDPPVLGENLRQLVELVRPTLVFMYDNAAVQSDAKDCFLALKDALGQLTDTSMFFLNTKADIVQILSDADPDDEGIPPEKIPEILLAERQHRYNLLLGVPSMASEFPGGLPKSLANCSCFDIISVNSESIDIGAELKQRTINRIVQFTANSDLKIAISVTKLVMPMIDAFFDFATIASRRTVEQLQLLRREALLWVESYFIRRRSELDKLLTDLYNIIMDTLGDEIDHIAQRAVQFKTAARIEEYVKTVVHEEIVKVAFINVIGMYINMVILDSPNDIPVPSNHQKNEILMAAQRSCNSHKNYYNKSLDNAKCSQLFLLKAKLTPPILIARILIESDGKQEGLYDLAKYKKIMNQDARKKQPLKKDFSSLDIAHQRLWEMFSWLGTQKNNFSKILDMILDPEKEELKGKIDDHYNLAVKFLSHREKAFELVTKYAGDLAYIECKIAAAMDLIEFNGNIPMVYDCHWLDERVHLASWANKNSFVVKKSSRHYEAHFHHKITQLNIPRIVPLLYLFENENTGEWWMFFPKYAKKLSDITVKIDQILTIVVDIGSALAELHQNEFVHRNVKRENVFLDENNQCYLANLDNMEYSKLLEITAKPEEISDDVYAFGQLGMFLYEYIANDIIGLSEKAIDIFTSLKAVLQSCMDPEAKARPKLVVVVKKINEMKEILHF